MRRIIYIFALLLIVVACKKNIVPKPDKFLDEKQMESLLYDLAVLESMKVSQAQILYNSIRNSSSTRNISSIAFRSHKIWSIMPPCLKTMTV